MAISVAFYGAGPRAEPYLRALSRRADVSVAAVCDLDRRAAEQLAAGWGAEVFHSYDAMLQRVRPDALWVCVRPSLQGDILQNAAERGIPFMVEPPGAADFAQAQANWRLINQAELVTAVGFLGRYTDLAREGQGYLGANPIPLALGWWLALPDENANRNVERLLWNDACQLLDSLRFFCGEVRKVRALSTATGTREGGLVLQLEFQSGTVGVVTCAAFARPEPRVAIELLGEGWTLGFSEGLHTLSLAERDKTTILRCLNQPTADQVAAFLAAVTVGDPAAVEPSYGDALRTLAVCHAAALSASEGRAVEMVEVEQRLDPPGKPADENESS